MAEFLCFVGTNFCDWEKLVFLAGKFQEVAFYLELLTSSFYEYK